MNELNEKIFREISKLNLGLDDEVLSKNIIDIAIKNIQDFVYIEINPFIEFSLIEDTFILIVIGEYLNLIKNSKIDTNIDIAEAIQTIKEGDTSITYFEEGSSSINTIIDYFYSKKRLLYNFKVIKW